MIYTLFFSRLRPMESDLEAEYTRRNDDLLRRVRQDYPGFVDSKTFVADDGERLTVVRFRDIDSQRAFKLDATHQTAQARGREDFYTHYRIAVCDELRSHEWHRESKPATHTEPAKEAR